LLVARLIVGGTLVRKRKTARIKQNNSADDSLVYSNTHLF
jgi:hypothetical protein